MMEAAISIQPFGFDRVFRFGGATEPAPAKNDELHAQIAALQERIEQMRQEQQTAVAVARAAGVTAGLAQARGERAEAMLAATDALHAALDDLDRQMADRAEQMAREAADVALCAAEILAGHALAEEPGRAIDEALGRVLKQVARGTDLHIRVHPESRVEVEQLVAVRRAAERRALSITIVEDAAIAPHDAHIGWAEGGLIVDADARRAAVMRELVGLIGDRDEA